MSEQSELENIIIDPNENGTGWTVKEKEDLLTRMTQLETIVASLQISIKELLTILTEKNKKK